MISSGPSAVGTAFTGARLAPSGVIYGVDQAVGVFNRLVVGGQLLQQSSENRAAEQRAATMQLCLERLSATVQGADPAAAFASALRAAAQAGQQPAGDAAAAGDGAPTAPQQRWSVAVPILRLREAGQPESLALELGLALRLEDVATGRLEGYELLLSGPDLPLQSPHTPASPLYAKFVPERAAPRPREEWCGPEGGSLLSAEITQALRNIAAQAARDFK